MARNPNRVRSLIAYGGGMVGRAKTPAPLFGQRLAALRKEMGLTQPQLAVELEISDKLVDYYERRAHNPSLEFVKKVADYFGVSPVYFTAEELPTRKRPGPKSKLDNAVEKARKLPRQKQLVVAQLIEAYVNAEG